ncbi:hypothetical protein [Dietzia sp. PP-33]|nr:hypothetical protein [Dietzia sp. PP-33]
MFSSPLSRRPNYPRGTSVWWDDWDWSCAAPQPTRVVRSEHGAE